MNKSKDREIPDWASEDCISGDKPNWIDGVPHKLWGLGKVFFPIPAREKGWRYPHHIDRFRHEATSEILNAYLEAGWGYGITCANNLAVVDVDYPEILEEIENALPDTLSQVTGSREGKHLFYLCSGLDTRINLHLGGEVSGHLAAEGIESESFIKRHIGEVKCDPHGYVVGPGSTHPSGNKYGPLEGDNIAIIDKEDLSDAVWRFVVKNDDSQNEGRDQYPEDYETGESSSTHPFYELDADDVLPWLEPNSRIAHPVHGSGTGSNFMKNKDRETFVCWRCQYGIQGGCVVNAQQLLALMEVGRKFGDYACEEVRRRWKRDSTLHYQAWRGAVKRGLVDLERIPYTVLKGYLISIDVMDEEDKLLGRHRASEQLKYEMRAELRDDVLE